MKQCPKCKKVFKREINFCTNCGAKVKLYIEPKKSKKSFETEALPKGIKFAGFWIRFFAYIIDSIILSVLMGVLISIMQNPVPTLISPIYFIIAIGSYGQTLGMKILRIRVCTLDSKKPIGIGKGIIRFIGFIFSSMILGIGLLWIAIDKKKQGFHDKIAKTIVIYD